MLSAWYGGTASRQRFRKWGEGGLNIVDGQQCLLTLTLLSTILDGKEKTISSTLLEHQFESSVSIESLKNNAQIISERVANLPATEKQELLNFVLKKCELIQVTLDDLSEAFQFFGSQNARGKALAPHDRLKAYHLREMMDSTEQNERLHHVSLWEQGVNPDDESANFHTIMGEFLFRMRRWIDGDYGIQFSRHNIDVFKGINLDSTQYAYVDAMLALDYAIETFNADPARKWDKQTKGYPFQVDQVMINGKRFFEYIQHYMTIHSSLFVVKDARLACPDASGDTKLHKRAVDDAP
ncbi:GmrSD restriction endonuclease domain-containing protein [Vibrio parahaemolyticus]